MLSNVDQRDWVKMIFKSFCVLVLWTEGALALEGLKMNLHYTVILIMRYSKLLPAPVDRTCSSAWLYKTPWIKCQTMQSTPMSHEACQLKLLSVVSLSMHLCQLNYVEIGFVVVYCARTAHAYSAGIKCWHCTVECPIINRSN